LRPLGILILAGQLRSLLGLPSASGQNFLEGLFQLVLQLPAAHLPSAAVGLGTILLILLMNKFYRKLPSVLISLVIASAAVFLLGWERSGVRVIGSLPRGLPPVAGLPLFDLDMLAQLSTGALAVGALG
jgi:SulP family sulfate permease